MESCKTAEWLTAGAIDLCDDVSRCPFFLLSFPMIWCRPFALSPTTVRVCIAVVAQDHEGSTPWTNSFFHRAPGTFVWPLTSQSVILGDDPMLWGRAALQRVPYQRFRRSK